MVYVIKQRVRRPFGLCFGVLQCSHHLWSGQQRVDYWEQLWQSAGADPALPAPCCTSPLDSPSSCTCLIAKCNSLPKGLRLVEGKITGRRLQRDLMRPTPALSVKTWRGRGGGAGWHVAGRGGGGGRGGEGGGYRRYGRGVVAMMCHWAVQREQNKAKRMVPPSKRAEQGPNT